MEKKQEEAVIKAEYEEMYRCMVQKDIAGLKDLFDGTFQLVHKNGAVQNREEYLAAIQNGTMNFYSYKHDACTVTISGEEAILVGQTTFQFGQKEAPDTSRLQLTIHLKKEKERWMMTHAVSAQY